MRATPWQLAVCKFPAEAALPAWAFHNEAVFWSLTRTPDELSLVCAEDDLPPSVDQHVERGWRAFELVGPVPFTTTGVISGLTVPLAEAGIGVFVISTYDTDYLLVKGAAFERAAAILGARFTLER
jgi:hypothetical protein